MKIAIAMDIWTSRYDRLLTTDGQDVLIRRPREIAPDAEILIVDTRTLDAADLQGMRDLKGIVRVGVGYDSLPLDYCRDRGIVLAYTPHAPSQSVAEMTLALILTALRRIPKASRSRYGRCLSEVTIGIVGAGRIGKRVIAMLSKLNPLAIYVFDPYADTTFDELHGVTRLASIDKLVDSVDVVSMHVPMTRETDSMICLDRLKMMPADGVVINTSRGRIVDEWAIARHLEANLAFTACLDCTDPEPYTGELLYLPNCILTHHTSSMTMAARHGMEVEAIAAALNIANGQRPRWEIPERELWAAAVAEHVNRKD